MGCICSCVATAPLFLLVMFFQRQVISGLTAGAIKGKTIKAVLFGSIGTIIETSDIQRNCFNQAFQKVGLNWYWSKKIYKSMLKKPGGKKELGNIV